MNEFCGWTQDFITVSIKDKTIWVSQGQTDIAMVKHSIDDNEIELITITTDDDLQEMPEMEKCIIKVNDVETVSSVTDEDSDSLSQILMGKRKQEIWYQDSSFKQRLSIVVCFVSYLFLLTSFVTMYFYILSDIISTNRK